MSIRQTFIFSRSWNQHTWKSKRPQLETKRYHKCTHPWIQHVYLAGFWSLDAAVPNWFKQKRKCDEKYQKVTCNTSLSFTAFLYFYSCMHRCTHTCICVWETCAYVCTLAHTGGHLQRAEEEVSSVITLHLIPLRQGTELSWQAASSSDLLSLPTQHWDLRDREVIWHSL